MHSLNKLNKSAKILIVGAGPTGLTSALFLKSSGYHPIVIDKKNEISRFSKALAINPRTLEIFKKYDIEKYFINEGYRLPAINMHKGKKWLFKNSFNLPLIEEPSMLILPQSRTEHILQNICESQNIKIKLDCELEGFVKNPDESFTVHTKNELLMNKYDCILACDGSRSQVRKSAGISQQGFSYEDPWEIFDLQLKTDLPFYEGHVFLLKEGAYIMIRIEKDIWRIAGNINNLLEIIKNQHEVIKVEWHSTFQIDHKISETLNKENIYILGDAAHLHSPVGARGMNLGIEDSHILARLFASHNEHTFNDVRKPEVLKTVKRINTITQLISGHSLKSRVFRQGVHLFGPLASLARTRLSRFILGYN